jgi:hypothetical protein
VVSLVSVFGEKLAQTGEHVEGIKTGETAESPVFMRLFAHVNENTELGGWDLVSIPPSPPFLQTEARRETIRLALAELRADKWEPDRTW